MLTGTKEYRRDKERRDLIAAADSAKEAAETKRVAEVLRQQRDFPEVPRWRLKKQKRRTVSMKPGSYRRLQEISNALDTPMAALIDTWIRREHEKWCTQRPAGTCVADAPGGQLDWGSCAQHSI